MKTIANLTALIGPIALAGAMSCATAKPSAELLSAREAYQAAEASPAKELNPADLHDAKVLLDDAESVAREDADSPVATTKAYVATRRAELATAQGKTSAATREKQRAQEQAQAIKDKALVTTKDKLALSSAAQTETLRELSQTQQQLDAEHKSRVEMHGQLDAAAATQQRSQDQLAEASATQQRTQDQLAEAAATQQRTAAQLSDAQGQVDSEHQARLTAEQSTLDALGKVAAVKREARGMVITLSGSVLFASGRSALLPGAQQRLDQVAQALKTSDRTILVEGFSDSRGSATGNQQLSQSRAQAVLDYLVPRGIQAQRIRAVGQGSSRPIAQNNTAEGRANNRRVEIVVESTPPGGSNQE
jgi:outer membrane protein OmpA-like peptidoglycan-associated protein